MVTENIKGNIVYTFYGQEQVDWKQWKRDAIARYSETDSRRDEYQYTINGLYVGDAVIGSETVSLKAGIMGVSDTGQLMIHHDNSTPIITPMPGSYFCTWVYSVPKWES